MSEKFTDRDIKDMFHRVFYSSDMDKEQTILIRNIVRSRLKSIRSSIDFIELTIDALFERLLKELEGKGNVSKR